MASLSVDWNRSINSASTCESLESSDCYGGASFNTPHNNNFSSSSVFSSAHKHTPLKLSLSVDSINSTATISSNFNNIKSSLREKIPEANNCEFQMLLSESLIKEKLILLNKFHSNCKIKEYEQHLFFEEEVVKNINPSKRKEEPKMSGSILFAKKLISKEKFKNDLKAYYKTGRFDKFFLLFYQNFNKSNKKKIYVEELL